MREKNTLIPNKLLTKKTLIGSVGQSGDEMNKSNATVVL